MNNMIDDFRHPAILAQAYRKARQFSQKVHVYRYKTTMGVHYWVWHFEQNCVMRASACPFWKG